MADTSNSNSGYGFGNVPNGGFPPANDENENYDSTYDGAGDTSIQSRRGATLNANHGEQSQDPFAGGMHIDLGQSGQDGQTAYRDDQSGRNGGEETTTQSAANNDATGRNFTQQVPNSTMPNQAHTTATVNGSNAEVHTFNNQTSQTPQSTGPSTSQTPQQNTPNTSSDGLTVNVYNSYQHQSNTASSNQFANSTSASQTSTANSSTATSANQSAVGQLYQQSNGNYTSIDNVLSMTEQQYDPTHGQANDRYQLGIQGAVDNDKGQLGGDVTDGATKYVVDAKRAGLSDDQITQNINQVNQASTINAKSGDLSQNTYTQSDRDDFMHHMNDVPTPSAGQTSQAAASIAAQNDLTHLYSAQLSDKNALKYDLTQQGQSSDQVNQAVLQQDRLNTQNISSNPALKTIVSEPQVTSFGGSDGQVAMQTSDFKGPNSNGSSNAATSASSDTTSNSSDAKGATGSSSDNAHTKESEPKHKHHVAKAVAGAAVAGAAIHHIHKKHVEKKSEHATTGHSLKHDVVSGGPISEPSTSKGTLGKARTEAKPKKTKKTHHVAKTAAAIGAIAAVHHLHKKHVEKHAHKAIGATNSRGRSTASTMKKMHQDHQILEHNNVKAKAHAKTHDNKKEASFQPFVM